jgi:hypothetical protein
MTTANKAQQKVETERRIGRLSKSRSKDALKVANLAEDVYEALVLQGVHQSLAHAFTRQMLDCKFEDGHCPSRKARIYMFKALQKEMG